MKILQFFNQHSYLVLAGMMLFAVSMIMLGGGITTMGVVVTALLVFALYSFRREAVVGKQAITASTPSKVAAGKPTLVEFYSDY